MGRLATCEANYSFIWEIYGPRSTKTISKLPEGENWANAANLSKNATMRQIKESMGKFEMVFAERREVIHTGMGGIKKGKLEFPINPLYGRFPRPKCISQTTCQ